MSTERESIARYLEHIAQQDIGTLIDGLTPREVAQFAASWVRNELDVKWAAEVLGRAIDSRGEREPRDNGEVSAMSDHDGRAAKKETP